MVLAVEQKNFALGSRQLSTKRFRELYGRESASDDNNSCGVHWLTPVSLLNEFGLCAAVRLDADAKKSSASLPSIGTKQYAVYRKYLNSIGKLLK
jgi:hypothetical protein